MKFRSVAKQPGRAFFAPYHPQHQLFACGHPKYYNPQNDENGCHTWEIYDDAQDYPFKVFVEGTCQHEYCALLAPLMAHEPEKIDLAVQSNQHNIDIGNRGLSNPPRKRSNVKLAQDNTVVFIPRAGSDFLRMQHRYAAYLRALTAIGERLVEIEPEVVETVLKINHPVILRLFALFKEAIDGKSYIAFEELNKDFDIQAQLDRLLEQQQMPWSRSQAGNLMVVAEKLNMLEAELRPFSVFADEIETLQQIFIEYNLLNVNSSLDGYRAHVAAMHFQQYLEPVEHRGSGPWSQFFFNYDIDAPRGRLDHHPSHVDPQVIADLNEWNFYQAYNERWRNHSFASLFGSSTASSMVSPRRAIPQFAFHFTASPMSHDVRSSMACDTPRSHPPAWLDTPDRKRKCSGMLSAAFRHVSRRARR